MVWKDLDWEFKFIYSMYIKKQYWKLPNYLYQILNYTT